MDEQSKAALENRGELREVRGDGDRGQHEHHAGRAAEQSDNGPDGGYDHGSGAGGHSHG